MHICNPAIEGDSTVAEPITLQVITKQAEPWYITIPASIGPYVIMSIAVIWITWYLYPKLKKDLFPRIGKISGYGLEIQLMAANVAEVYKSKKESIPSTLLLADVGERLLRIREKIQGQSIIWVDSHPQNNAAEIELLKNLGVNVESVKTHAEGIAKINTISPAITISSWSKANDFADQVAALQKEIRIIIYTSHEHVDEPRQRSVFGITDQPVELFHLVADAFERLRG